MDTHNKGEQLLQTLKEIREEKEAQMATAIETKKCSKCGDSLPATEEYFYKDNRAKNGLSSWCRQCQKSNQKDLYDQKHAIVTLDFGMHPEMFDQLAKEAGDEFREIDQQVLWIIKDYFESWTE